MRASGDQRLVPKPQTSNNLAKGSSTNATFATSHRRTSTDVPPVERAIWRFTPIEHGHDAASILVIGLPTLPDQGAMHDERLPAHRAMGTRGVLDAMQARLKNMPDASRIRRRPSSIALRHAQILDGGDALPDEDDYRT